MEKVYLIQSSSLFSFCDVQIPSKFSSILCAIHRELPNSTELEIISPAQFSPSPIFTG